jgi:hypothetical protein
MKRAIIATAAMAFSVPSASAPAGLDMTAFFTGRTHAENVLRIAFKRPSKLVVDSVGKNDGKEFVLVDTIHEEGQPVRTRKWVMRPVGPGHYAGSLSDAVGPVDVTVGGRRAIIRYKMKGGLNVTQQLDMQDARTLSNRVNVRKFGLKFGSVEGTIRKLD